MKTAKHAEVVTPVNMEIILMEWSQFNDSSGAEPKKKMEKAEALVRCADKSQFIEWSLNEGLRLLLEVGVWKDIQRGTGDNHNIVYIVYRNFLDEVIFRGLELGVFL